MLKQACRDVKKEGIRNSEVLPQQMELVPTRSPCWLVGERHVIIAKLTKMLSLLVIISVL